jgi:translation initiation factor 1
MSVCDTCGLPKEICVCEEIAREQQEITITTTTRRYGKTVTIVKGLNPDDIDVKSLTVDLKNACACGGSYKDGNIELQGDHREKVQDELEEMGFHAEIR